MVPKEEGEETILVTLWQGQIKTFSEAQGNEKWMLLPPVTFKGLGQKGRRGRDNMWRIRQDGGPFAEVPNPAGAKQATEMPTGVCVAAVPSQMGPFGSLMQEMPLPECVRGS